MCIRDRFNTLAAKQVLRDVGKAMQVAPRQIDLLCKLVPNRPKVTLQDAYQERVKFKQMINSGEQMRKLFAIALQLEGLPRHSSLHAAGIILSNEEMCIRDRYCLTHNIEAYIKYSMYSKEKEKKYKKNLYNKANWMKDTSGRYILSLIHIYSRRQCFR